MGIITITGELDDDLYNEFLHEFIELELNEHKIVVYLNSNGGSVRNALSIYDLLTSSKCETIGVVIGTCYSAANVVLQACSKRYALPNAAFMHHLGTSEIPEVHWSEFSAAVKNEIAEMDKADEVIASRVKDLAALKPMYKKGTFFNAKQALRIGLIDDILTTRL